ncbi:MAG: FAD-dependent oxidoreductase, partial [Deltaproteobacteria bacterium]
GLTGCETALWLAEQGKKVTIVEMLPRLMDGGPPVPHMNKVMLLDLLTVQKVSMLTNAHVQEITNEAVIIVDRASSRKTIIADTVVLALGLKSNDELGKLLEGKVAHMYTIGDCREPRNIMGAVWDGYEVGRAV